MRLNKIKLAGFKSFVDPTTVSFQTDLTGIVGPNGCGKSNIIDAVRWVMGESSAKQLRGEDMTDVIFNGAATRKPVGQASVDLVFDNNDGALGGEYAQYSEISIRREVNREAISHYYLNNTRCRRKDITDVFLGTGLGPRSYAIIEQGMISKLIEAKPDELRVYLEEAANISKYKERRKETENRIHHTRENLNRLNDLRSEINKQLEYLKRQAKAAERYKELKKEERLLNVQLKALEWRIINQQREAQEHVIKEEEVRVDAKIAEQRTIDTGIEKLRIQHTDFTDTFNQVQGRYYSLGADITKFEQRIQHNKERRKELQQDLEQINISIKEILENKEEDEAQIEEFTTDSTALAPEAEQAKRAAEHSQQALLHIEQRIHDWQIEWDTFNENAAQATQQVELEQIRLQHLEQHINHTKQRIEKIKQEKEVINFTGLPEEIANLSSQYRVTQTQNDACYERLNNLHKQIIEQREQDAKLATELDKARTKLQNLQGRYFSLEALQQAAFGKDDNKFIAWLTKYQLAKNPRLVEELRVESGWEKVVETVLGHYLEAVCVQNLNELSEKLSDFDEGSVMLLDTSNESLQHTTRALIPLATKVHGQWAHKLLHGVYIAESLTQALALRTSLKHYESVITQDGIWIGASWIRINRNKSDQSGLLQREQELKSLKETIKTQENFIVEKEKLREQSKITLQDLEKQSMFTQEQFKEIIKNHTELRAQLTIKQTQFEHLKSREKTFQHELEELQHQLTDTEQQIAETKTAWHKAIQHKTIYTERRKLMLEQREQYRSQLASIRDQIKQDKEFADELSMRLESTKNQLDFLYQGLTRAEKQIGSLQIRKKTILTSIEEAETPLQNLQAELEQALQKRLAIETEMFEAKQKLEDVEHSLHELENKRILVEEHMQHMRNYLEKMRMEWQGLQVRCATYQEQITESGFQLDIILQDLPQESERDTWVKNLEHVNNRIHRLGPINLAAIGEYDQQLERKTYLDSQYTDLIEALETLENAIRKIDKETRERFKKTFNTVNVNFQELFPKMFGGGKAELILTGDDLLSTGVSLMAQPPGKRNTTIHLLSGGEKALTAIALVFAIFQLNPAPFCLLDEVDAPLDDANVINFTNLIKDMSKKVQLVFISHNKLTIEAAEQLAGVTMTELGVSRLVSVDIQEAMEMVEAE